MKSRTGFADADLVLEETILHQSLSHHPMEPRSVMAYWQNEKLYLHASTQSTAPHPTPALANRLGMDQSDVVLIAEYCGGGFGSKISGAPINDVAAVLSRKTGRPVMLRINRYEETYIGRARPGFQSFAKMGFRNDGRVTAIDLYIVQDAGSYGSSGDFNTAGTVASLCYQPEHMRFRAVSVYTNTPPAARRSGLRAAHRSWPCSSPSWTRPRANWASTGSTSGASTPPGNDGWLGANQGSLSSSFAPEALDLGAEVFGLGGEDTAERDTARHQVDRGRHRHQSLRRRKPGDGRAAGDPAGRQALHPPGHRQPGHALHRRHRPRGR